jgi:hypothetical protein
MKYPKLLELHQKIFRNENEQPKHLHNSFNDILVTLRCFMFLKFKTDLLVTCENFNKTTKLLEIYYKFDFSFLPDYFQEPKHYIFHCQNRVNGLIYGHMGIILYNCNMVISAKEYDVLGLDYTLSFPHEVIPVVSCHGNFDTTAYHTWRTAFRETSKLAYFDSLSPSVENQHRLETWLSKAQGSFAKWCLLGAKDGVEFFQESQGNLSILKNSFRWQWLRDRFVDLYGEID